MKRKDLIGMILTVVVGLTLSEVVGLTNWFSGSLGEIGLIAFSAIYLLFLVAKTPK